MLALRTPFVIALVALLGIAGCATRPVNAPLAHVDHAAGYRFQTREHYFRDHENLIIHAFSGVAGEPPRSRRSST